MQKYYPMLEKCPLFRNIRKENLFHMLGCIDARVVSYSKNETIWGEGAPVKDIGIVLSGNVQIWQIDYYGNRSIMGNVEPSELFGESFACAGVKELPVDVVAAEQTEVLLINCQRIIRSCKNACQFHSQIIFNLLQVVARKNLAFREKIQITSRRTTREKLLAYLQEQAKRAGSDEFFIPFDRQELADYLEVDRSGLSAEISKLRKEGKVECKKNYFHLL